MFDMSMMLGNGSVANQVSKIPCDDLIEYRNHPFTTYDGERLEDMVASIKANGVIVPIIARPIENGKYEILSGHNRTKAAKLAGLITVPAIIKNGISDEEAELYVTETNLLQRGFGEMKISEQARVLAVRYSEMFSEKKQAAIAEELGMLEGGSCTTKLAETGKEYGLSQATVARLLRIAMLSDELKAQVDEGRIKIRTAVELSFVPLNIQKYVDFCMNKQESDYILPYSTAKEIREFVESRQNFNSIIRADIMNIILEDKLDKKIEKPKSVKVTKQVYDKYFSNCKDKKIITQTIELALEEYFKTHSKDIA